MAEQMVIFTRAYDFLSWILPIAESFPKSQRFVVTARLQSAILNFQECIIEANSHRGRQRIERLQDADAELLKVRLYLRLCEKWGWIKPGQYRHVSEMVAELGRLLGGWIKSVTNEPR